MSKVKTVQNPNESAKRKAELDSDIKSYDRLLKRHPDNDNAYYAKAGALLELGQITGDKSYYSHSLNCYNKALDISPHNPTYIADRGKLYTLMGRNDLAAQTTVELKNLPDTGNKFAEMYKNQTVHSLLKLDGVQGEVSKLIKAGKIPNELDKVFAGMIDVIKGVNATVGEHNIKLIEHDKKFDEQDAELKAIKVKLVEYEQAYKTSAPDFVEIIHALKAEIVALQEKVIQHDQSIEEINNQIIEISKSQEEFDELSQKLEDVELKQDLFDGKIKVVEGKLKKQDKAIVNINKTLEQSNCFDKQKVKNGFEELRHEDPDQTLYNYANNFYWFLSNYLLAYRSISSGAVNGVRDKNKLEKIWDKVGSWVVNLTGFIPVVGSAFSLIEEGLSSLNDNYKDMKFERKVEKINQLITNYMLEEDLNLAVASAGIKIAKIKKQEIIDKHKNAIDEQLFKDKSKNKIDKKIDEFREKIDKMLTKIMKISKTQETSEGKMAVEDVILFLNYLAMNEITLATKDNISSLDEVISETFKTSINNTNHALRKAIDNKLNQNNVSQEKCIIAKVDDITYDNPLLNHPELLKAAVKNYGISISKAIDLSQQLSPELISQVIGTQDQSLLLAGILSLNLDNNGN